LGCAGVFLLCLAVFGRHELAGYVEEHFRKTPSPSVALQQSQQRPAPLPKERRGQIPLPPAPQ
jgi:hypothetical protein